MVYFFFVVNDIMHYFTEKDYRYSISMMIISVSLEIWRQNVLQLYTYHNSWYFYGNMNFEQNILVPFVWNPGLLYKTKICKDLKRAYLYYIYLHNIQEGQDRLDIRNRFEVWALISLFVSFLKTSHSSVIIIYQQSTLWLLFLCLKFLTTSIITINNSI